MSDTTVCPLGLSDNALAAWYDAILGDEEARRIGDHVLTCVVCQSQLAGYDQIDQAVRSQRVPHVATDRLWEAVHAGMSSAKGMSHDSSSKQHHRQLLGSLGAVAAAILVVVGFLHLFQSHASVQGQISSATATTAKLLASPTPLLTFGPSALPVPGTPLSWQSHAVPVQFIQQQSELNLAVWAGNGAIAYICNPITISGGHGVQQPQIWVTHDLGTTWGLVGNLPVLGQVAECSLDIDATDNSRLVALLSGYNVQSLAPFTDDFASDNGGVTWTMVAQGQNFTVGIEQIASAQDKTYAIYTTSSPWPAGAPTPTTVLTPMKVETHLAVSTGGLRTWQPVDQPILKLAGANQHVKQFWAQVGVSGQEILLADVGAVPTLSPPPQPDTLWTSQDGGAHWTQLPAPDLENYLAQATPTGHSWYLCGSSHGPSLQSSQSSVIACSMDGGQTWIPRPALRTCASCAEQPVGMGDSYIASDGSLVGLFVDGNGNEARLALYRLPANSSQWQYLGQVPNSDNGLMYAPSPSAAGSGYIWIYGGSTGGYDLSATVGGTGNATGVFSTAAYAS